VPSSRVVSAILLAALAWCEARADALPIAPFVMNAIGTVDARFQSYNVEMVEVTGGRFWKPYRKSALARAHTDRDRYSDRPPTDLTNPRLRKLAAALGPAYMRVSGTWANATFFADVDNPPAKPPAGYDSVLSRAQWRGVIDFARMVDAEIMTSFGVSPGSRDANGAWRPDQAQHLVAFTRSLGGHIAAAEFMNEPTLAATNGAPAGYDAKAYRRDFAIFHGLMRQSSPAALIVGPGSVGDTLASSSPGMRTRDLLAATEPSLDRFSYHHYGTLSPRCGGRDEPAQALSEEWLSRTDRAFETYRALRDELAPGKPIWLTETADAACGGNPWDATFLDTFRYLDQLGRLAKAGVQVVMHNTLAASDYGLLEEQTFRPRPNYWAALLWHRLMGTTVLDAGPAAAGLHIYAHCHPGRDGTVSVLAINVSRHVSHDIRLPLPAQRYTLQAARLQGSRVKLNGRPLALGAADELPDPEAIPTPAGVVRLAPATITFLTFPDAGNPACL
jgi:hypothetical protein